MQRTTTNSTLNVGSVPRKKKFRCTKWFAARVAITIALIVLLFCIAYFLIPSAPISEGVAPPDLGNLIKTVKSSAILMHIVDAMILLYTTLPRYCTIYNQYAKFICRFYLNLAVASIHSIIRLPAILIRNIIAQVVFLNIITVSEAAVTAAGITFMIHYGRFLSHAPSRMKKKVILVYICICWYMVHWFPHTQLRK